MRILHLDTGPTLRGGQQQILLLLRGLRAQHCPQMLLAPVNSPLALRARQEGFQVREIEFQGWHILTTIAQIRAALKEFNPELFHFHDARAHGFGQGANRKVKLPAVISRRVAFPLKQNPFSRQKYSFPRQRFIAVSAFIRNQLIQSGMNPSRVDVVYDGVDIHAPAVFNPAGIAGVKGTGFTIGSVGALEAEKGYDLLIEAIARIQPRLPELRCMIAGHGSKRAALERLVSKRRTNSILRIVDFPDSLPNFLRALELFVLPSRSEGLGSILLMAMHCGVSVLASAVGGIPEIVEHEKTGFLFPGENVDALSQMLEGLARDPVRRKSVIDAARAKIRSQFSVEEMTRATLACYERALASA